MFGQGKSVWEYQVREIVSWGTVWLENCLIGELPGQLNAWFGNLSVGEQSKQGTFRNRELLVKELPRNQFIFMQIMTV